MLSTVGYSLFDNFGCKDTVKFVQNGQIVNNYCTKMFFICLK